MLAGDIARRAALAIHNAQSTAAHVEVSQALQQALLPRALPVAPGLDFAAAYLPASSGSDVGGDFYDVLTVDPARWLVSIGDVCGKGARAAARTGLVRDVLRVLVRDGPAAAARRWHALNDVMMEAGRPAAVLHAGRRHRAAGPGSRHRRGWSSTSCWPGTCSRSWCAPTAPPSWSASSARPSG